MQNQTSFLEKSKKIFYAKCKFFYKILTQINYKTCKKLFSRFYTLLHTRNFSTSYLWPLDKQSEVRKYYRPIAAETLYLWSVPTVSIWETSD